MSIFKTPNATVTHDGFHQIEIQPKEGSQSIDLMDIKAIYAAFFRNWLQNHIEHMTNDDVIKLGYYVGERYQ